MVVTHMVPSIFPNILLRIFIGCRDGEPHDLQAWMGSQKLSDRLSPMPRSAIPEQQDRAGRNGRQDLLKVLGCGVRIHSGGLVSYGQGGSRPPPCHSRTVCDSFPSHGLSVDEPLPCALMPGLLALVLPQVRLAQQQSQRAPCTRF